MASVYPNTTTTTTTTSATTQQQDDIDSAQQPALHLADTSMELVTESSSTVLRGHPSEEERSKLMDNIYTKLLDGPRIDILSKLPYEIASYVLHF
ncbi:hypothetical protein BGZ96_005228, partial [Linnemannia gamsii]